MAQENDIILVYFEDKPLIFARIEDISADRKPGWYQVKLLVLQVPVQVVTWILREAYINGEEFTMNGKKMRLERVVSPEASANSEARDKNAVSEKASPTLQKTGGSNVISLSDLKKK